jgi:hypothetical protein
MKGILATGPPLSSLAKGLRGSPNGRAGVKFDRAIKWQLSATLRKLTTCGSCTTPGVGGDTLPAGIARGAGALQSPSPALPAGTVPDEHVAVVTRQSFRSSETAC